MKISKLLIRVIEVGPNDEGLGARDKTAARSKHRRCVFPALLSGFDDEGRGSGPEFEDLCPVREVGIGIARLQIYNSTLHS